MKQIIMSVGLLSCVLCIEAKERAVFELPESYKNREARSQRPGLDNKTRAILAQFASIVMGFLGILQDPNNPANVTSHVTDMVNNAVNIVTEAVKSGKISRDATEQELHAFAEETVRSLFVRE